MPLIIATPSTTAIAVSAVRSLRVARLRSVSRVMPRRATRPVVDDAPVGELDDAVGDVGGVGVVGDHDDGLAELVDGAAQQRRARRRDDVRVEVAGRLVGEHDRGPRDERAGDGDALLLAAGQLARAVRAAVVEADGVDERARATRGRACGRRSTAAGRCSPPR